MCCSDIILLKKTYKYEKTYKYDKTWWYAYGGVLANATEPEGVMFMYIL